MIYKIENKKIKVILKDDEKGKGNRRVKKIE